MRAATDTVLLLHSLNTLLRRPEQWHRCSLRFYLSLANEPLRTSNTVRIKFQSLPASVEEVGKKPGTVVATSASKLARSALQSLSLGSDKPIDDEEVQEIGGWNNGVITVKDTLAHYIASREQIENWAAVLATSTAD